MNVLQMIRVQPEWNTGGTEVSCLSFLDNVTFGDTVVQGSLHKKTVYGESDLVLYVVGVLYQYYSGGDLIMESFMPVEGVQVEWHTVEC